MVFILCIYAYFLLIVIDSFKRPCIVGIFRSKVRMSFFFQELENHDDEPNGQEPQNAVYICYENCNIGEQILN